MKENISIFRKCLDDGVFGCIDGKAMAIILGDGQTSIGILSADDGVVGLAFRRPCGGDILQITSTSVESLERLSKACLSMVENLKEKGLSSVTSDYKEMLEKGRKEGVINDILEGEG